jgi:5-methylcytosine-specific restriction endonuclease McrA
MTVVNSPGRTMFDRAAPVPARARSDRRYHTSKWRRTPKAVLARDGFVCQLDERCPHVVRVVDHINPVHPAMSDAEFYDRANLRAACVTHNVARGFERLERQHTGNPPAVALGAKPARPRVY